MATVAARSIRAICGDAATGGAEVAAVSSASSARARGARNRVAGAAIATGAVVTVARTARRSRRSIVVARPSAEPVGRTGTSRKTCVSALAETRPVRGVIRGVRAAAATTCDDLCCSTQENLKRVAALTRRVRPVVVATRMSLRIDRLASRHAERRCYRRAIASATLGGTARSAAGIKCRSTNTCRDRGGGGNRGAKAGVTRVQGRRRGRDRDRRCRYRSRRQAKFNADPRTDE